MSRRQEAKSAVWCIWLQSLYIWCDTTHKRKKNHVVKDRKQENKENGTGFPKSYENKAHPEILSNMSRFLR